MAVYKEGSTYYFIARVKTRNGKTKQVKKRGFKKRKEAQLAEAQFVLDWENEELDEENFTFEKVAEEYLEWYRKRRKESSYIKIASIVNTHLIPRFGKKRLENIRNRDITRYHDDLIDSDMAVSHIKKIHTTLSAVFRHAMKQEYTKVNPAAAVGNVDLDDDTEMKYWTLEEFKQFISVVEDDLYRTLFMTLYYSGMRKGELLALTWKDLNFEENTINIDKTAYNRKITTTKTKGSTRTINMPDHTMRLLSQLKAAQAYYKPEYVVFGEFHDHISTTTLDRKFEKYIKEAGVKKIRLHDFRHSHASYLINKGAIISVVSHRLGHSNPSTTLNTYSHMYPSTEKEVVSMMENDFEKAKIYEFKNTN